MEISFPVDKIEGLLLPSDLFRESTSSPDVREEFNT